LKVRYDYGKTFGIVETSDEFAFMLPMNSLNVGVFYFFLLVDKRTNKYSQFI